MFANDQPIKHILQIRQLVALYIVALMFLRVNEIYRSIHVIGYATGQA